MKRKALKALKKLATHHSSHDIITSTPCSRCVVGRPVRRF
jgi:hypothetical protein